MKPNPKFFLNFLKRYFRVLIIWSLFVIGGQIDAVVFFFGHVYYVVEFTFSCLIAALFVRHMVFRRSVDAYSIEPDEGDSEFVRDWKELEKPLRVVLAIITYLTLYLGACWIAASISK